MGTRNEWERLYDGRIYKTAGRISRSTLFERRGHSKCVFIKYITHLNGHVQELRTPVRSSRTSIKRHE
jgi:hypothetical protein